MELLDKRISLERNDYMYSQYFIDFINKQERYNVICTDRTNGKVKLNITTHGVIGTHAVDLLNSSFDFQHWINLFEKFRESGNFIPEDMDSFVNTVCDFWDVLFDDGGVLLSLAIKLQNCFNDLLYFDELKAIGKISKKNKSIEAWEVCCYVIGELTAVKSVKNENNNMYRFCLCDSDKKAFHLLTPVKKFHVLNSIGVKSSKKYRHEAIKPVTLIEAKDEQCFALKNMTIKKLFDGTYEQDEEFMEYLKYLTTVNVGFYGSTNIYKGRYRPWLDEVLQNIIQYNIPVNVCQNCGKLFIPKHKVSEIYCDNVYKNNKTCGQVGYENKLNRDEILKAYRTAYKTQNAKKHRNHHISDIEKRFKKWHMEAKNKLADTQEGKMTLDDFNKWLKVDWTKGG